MKTLTTLCLAALTAAAAYAADVVPSFNATLTVGKENRFVLVGADGKSSSWLALGDSFQGYTIKDYDSKAEAVDLEKDGKVTRVGIAGDAVLAGTVAGAADAKAGGASATVAEATALLDTIQFEKLMDRTLGSVRKAQADALKQMLPKNASPEDRAAFEAFQTKVLDTMMSSLSGQELKNDVAKIYSDVFSKDELQGMSAFYASPLGQALLDKQPAIAQKTNEVLLPRIMATMPKIQQMQREFMTEMRAKKQAAQATATPAPAPAPAPAATQPAQ